VRPHHVIVETAKASVGPGKYEAWLPVILLAIVGGSLPLWGDSFFGLVATRVCVYWVLVAGLNLVVGFAGQLAIGWVSLLTIGAYAASALAGGRVTPEIPTIIALAAAGLLGAVFGLIAGLPALRLRTFYFAMTTLGLSTIVTQIALAWKTVTGGGVGIPGPSMPAPLDGPWGFYFFCLALALLVTWMTCNISASRYGRSLVAIRDAEVAAEAVGIHKPRLLVAVFLFSGALAGIAGGLFASLQSYITPDAFTSTCPCCSSSPF
jgi:branched-chain amino acid transport system permease protein